MLVPRRMPRRFISALTLSLVAAGLSVAGAPGAHAQAVKQAGRNPCLGYPLVTTVVYWKDGTSGTAIKVWAEPKETENPKVSIGAGVEVKGRPTFTVVAEEGAWYKVNLPVRPNGTQGYVRKDDVKSYQHPWNIVVELGRKELTVCNSGRVVQVEKIGVGKQGTPTPTGECFTADLIQQRNPRGGYGPYAYGLSCFSDVIFKFGAGGDGRLGIHGTNQPGKLGTAVSSGCIRVNNNGITKMKKTLPLGIPVHIIN